MDDAEKAIEKHIRAVKAVLQSSGSNAARTDAIEQELRDHIDEAMSEPDADHGRILRGLDAPESYGDISPELTVSDSDRKGHIGFFGGLVCVVLGLLVLPNIIPHSAERIGPPIFVIGMILSFTLGIAGRRGKFGLASILLSVAMMVFILIMNVTRG